MSLVCIGFSYTIYSLILSCFQPGVYSSWFATQSHPPPSSTSSESNLLLTVLTYVVSALTDLSLSLSAAVALRNLCEANRKDLAAHIGAFGELHAGLDRIPVRPLI